MESGGGVGWHGPLAVAEGGVGGSDGDGAGVRVDCVGEAGAVRWGGGDWRGGGETGVVGGLDGVGTRGGDGNDGAR